MYAVIKTGGKQYKVAEGDVIFIEKLEVEGEDVSFEDVIAVGKDDGIVFGTPNVEGAVVKAKLLKTGRGKKINIFTYRAKKGSSRKMGHRQAYSKVQILTINA